MRRPVGIAALAVGVVASLGLAFWLVYTPTVTVHLINDTNTEVTVSCGSDPPTLIRGQRVDLELTAHNARTACIVYQGEGRDIIGCLRIPTTRYHDGSTVRVSAMTPTTSGACGG